MIKIIIYKSSSKYYDQVCVNVKIKTDKNVKVKS